ncbi:MAG: cell division protein FtsW, partial [Candidatus Thiodiazotropha endolucinida]
MKLLTGIIGYSSIIMVVILGAMVLLSPYRMERVSAYIDPWDAPKHTDEQLTEALIAFGR